MVAPKMPSGRPRILKVLLGCGAVMALGLLLFGATEFDEQQRRENDRRQASDQASGLYFNNKVTWYESGFYRDRWWNCTVPTQQSGVYGFSYRENGTGPIKQVQILATGFTNIVIENM